MQATDSAPITPQAELIPAVELTVTTPRPPAADELIVTLAPATIWVTVWCHLPSDWQDGYKQFAIAKVPSETKSQSYVPSE